MPVRIREFYLSRSGTFGKDSQSRQLIMTVDGTSDDAVAKAFIVANMPATFDNLTLSDIRYETLGGVMWRATANYTPDTAPLFPAVGIVGPPTPVPALPGPNDPLPSWIDFDFMGVEEHITQSKETIHRILRQPGDPVENSAPDNQRAIGITKDGKVEGTRKISPNIEIVMTVTFASVTQLYVDMLSEYTGSTNNATWFNRPAKSLIFLGGTTQTKDVFKKIVTLRFLQRPNLTSISICDDLTVPAKAGSEYLWVSYKSVADGKITQQPTAAYVERICDLKNFEDFRIGV